MRYIKSYKIFESKSFPTNVAENIKDIFRELELNDMSVEFECDVYYTDDGGNKRHALLVDINPDYKLGLLNFYDVKECISRLFRYFKTLDDKYKLVISPPHDEYYSIDEFIQEYSRSEEFSSFTILIYSI